MIAPPGLAICPHCAGIGHFDAESAQEIADDFALGTWDSECFICEGTGTVPEAFAAEWQDALDERADIDEIQHLAEFQDWYAYEGEQNHGR